MTFSIEWIGPLPSSNFGRGRGGAVVDRIVDHWMAGTFAGADARFRDPNAVVSAHFGVLRTGRIVQWVALEDTAYHAGNFEVNRRSVGIEHEGGPDVEFTEIQYAATAWLHRYLADQYAFEPAVDGTVFGHRAIVPTQCPGTLDLFRIVREAGDEMSREQFDQWFAENYAKYGLVELFDRLKKIDAYFAHHRHVVRTPLTSEPFPPMAPIDGAEYAGSNADLSIVIWKYPDGSTHSFQDGAEIAEEGGD